jgi:hypothetical protein
MERRLTETVMHVWTGEKLVDCIKDLPIVILLNGRRAMESKRLGRATKPDRRAEPHPSSVG